MLTEAKLMDEAARLSALKRYEILDTPREEGFDRITQLVSAVLHAPICTISLIDADRQWLKSCIGVPREESERDTSFCTHTIRTREPLYIPDTTMDSVFADNPFVTGEPFLRSYLGVPLSTPDGYNVGALCVVDLVPRMYKPRQVEILKSFAALAVDELEMRRIAQTDHLTGAATRRSFTLEMEKALARYNRSESTAALILLDIDYFKRVNDTYGHPAGDSVLKAVSGKLTSVLRQGDLLGRLGGEEFGVLLQVTDDSPALETAERLRLHLEALIIEHDPPLKITASFGVASLQPYIESPQQWLALADKALYEAKRTGRNRCCVDQPGVN